MRYIAYKVLRAVGGSDEPRLWRETSPAEEFDSIDDLQDACRPERVADIPLDGEQGRGFGEHLRERRDFGCIVVNGACSVPDDGRDVVLRQIRALQGALNECGERFSCQIGCGDV